VLDGWEGLDPGVWVAGLRNAGYAGNEAGLGLVQTPGGQQPVPQAGEVSVTKQTWGNHSRGRVRSDLFLQSRWARQHPQCGGRVAAGFVGGVVRL